ncbi:unnamed protein product [Prunus armeniaca]
MADIKLSLLPFLMTTSNIFGTPLPLPLSKLTWMHHGIQTQKRFGIGILIRNTHGDFIKGTSIPSVVNSAIEAEAQACLEGYKLAAEMGYRQIPRTANQAADHLAMLAISRMSPEVWVNRPPSSLMHIMNKDGLPCPPRST